MQAKTAILVFGNSAQREAEIKHFAPGLGAMVNERIAQGLIHKTLQTVSQAQLSVVTCFGPQQQGPDFGSRLANALESTFCQGFEQVIVVGTDSPTLTVSHLHQAYDHLLAGRMALGPSIDGGVYLLAIRRQDYKRQNFLSWAWQSEGLLTSIFAESKASQIELLEPGHDLDNATDFDAYLQTGQGALRIFFLRVVHIQKQPGRRTSGAPLQDNRSITYTLRGPPQIV